MRRLARSGQEARGSESAGVVAGQEEKEAVIWLGGAKSKVEALGCGRWWDGDPDEGGNQR